MLSCYKLLTSEKDDLVSFHNNMLTDLENKVGAR